jgi:hypothetical protein
VYTLNSMLDKILGVLAVVACILLCLASWLYQDVMLARRMREEEQEEIENHAASQEDDAENNRNRKRRVQFPSDVTMVSIDLFKNLDMNVFWRYRSNHAHNLMFRLSP